MLFVGLKIDCRVIDERRKGASHKGAIKGASYYPYVIPASHKTMTPKKQIYFILALLGVLVVTLIITYGLPQLLAPEIYIHAGFDFVTKTFANDWGTVGTDYGLAVLMSSPAVFMLLKVKRSRFRDRSAGLLLFYALSVIVGGISHQSFDSLSSLNTPTFRIMWSVCVGSVTAAGGYIGSIGSALAHMSNR